ncbi:MAG: hypothetical protein ACO1QB_04345 [Verrucomicrobiales bacterium]
MTNDNLQRFIELREALLEDRSAIQNRIQEIERALGNINSSASIPSTAVTQTPQPSQTSGKRKMSEEGRKRIAEAQRLRRLKERGENDAANSKVAPRKGKRQMSEAGRKAIAEGARKRWSAVKHAGRSNL